MVICKHSSLVEEMLRKTTTSASARFSSVPWDPGTDDSDSRDYLRIIIPQMNRDVVVHYTTFGELRVFSGTKSRHVFCIGSSTTDDGRLCYGCLLLKSADPVVKVQPQW